MGRNKFTHENYECEFVGEGEEDLKVIVKRQFVRWLNERHSFPVIGIKEDIITDHFRKSYHNSKKKT
ncbi:hypothetical protein [Sutcliffiella horikoshii]|uniref:hypothetical protein n=1 Tax=Sutcliffiella horikoshii TaxID=79883 RepID=UPI001F391EF1|nr:hypothetical protein [Sutcliffiella horikoshii]MCG1020786.1 hypothetical protein [Sutcliffiella horikoshii]